MRIEQVKIKDLNQELRVLRRKIQKNKMVNVCENKIIRILGDIT